MFENFVLGMPAPYSPSLVPLTNISPGTRCPPTSYFPPMPRRPSAHRFSSLDGLENALEAMERRPGNEIEIDRDEVDTLVCESPEGEEGMILEGDAEDELNGEKMLARERREMMGRGDAMGRRRMMRGLEGRRLAMIENQVRCGNAQQFVEEAERQQEQDATAFKERVQAAGKETQNDDAHTEEREVTLALPLAKPTAISETTPFEFAQPRRHSMFYTPAEHHPRSRSSSVSASPGEEPECIAAQHMRPTAEWLKAYSSVVGKTHLMERRHSVGKGGVLHARVQKKIYGRRGM